MISKWNILLNQRLENKDHIMNEQALLELRHQVEDFEKNGDKDIEKFTGPLSHSNLVKSLEQPEEDDDSDKEV